MESVNAVFKFPSRGPSISNWVVTKSERDKWSNSRNFSQESCFKIPSFCSVVTSVILRCMMLKYTKKISPIPSALIKCVQFCFSKKTREIGSFFKPNHRHQHCHLVSNVYSNRITAYIPGCWLLVKSKKFPLVTFQSWLQNLSHTWKKKCDRFNFLFILALEKLVKKF